MYRWLRRAWTEIVKMWKGEDAGKLALVSRKGLLRVWFVWDVIGLKSRIWFLILITFTHKKQITEEKSVTSRCLTRHCHSAISFLAFTPARSTQYQIIHYRDDWCVDGKSFWEDSADSDPPIRRRRILLPLTPSCPQTPGLHHQTNVSNPHSLPSSASRLTPTLLADSTRGGPLSGISMTWIPSVERYIQSIQITRYFPVNNLLTRCLWAKILWDFILVTWNYQIVRWQTLWELIKQSFLQNHIIKMQVDRSRESTLSSHSFKIISYKCKMTDLARVHGEFLSETSRYQIARWQNLLVCLIWTSCQKSAFWQNSSVSSFRLHHHMMMAFLDWACQISFFRLYIIWLLLTEHVRFHFCAALLVRMTFGMALHV